MFSVLVPARNCAKTIRLAIRTTLGALPSDGEILVGDDGSTDATAEVVRAEHARDPRVRLVESTEGIGVAALLNRLSAQATKPYIARMDGDDVSLPGRFHGHLRELARGVQISFSTRVNFGSSFVSFRPAPLGRISSEEMPYWLAITNPVPHSSMAARRETFAALGGYVPGPAEDYELWMRASVLGTSISRSGIPGIGYRLHSGQVTKSPSWVTRYQTDRSLEDAHQALSVSLGWEGPSMWRAIVSSDSSDGAVARRYFDFLLSGFPARNLRGRLAFRRAVASAATDSKP